MKDQEDRLMHAIRSYYRTTGKLRDLIDACEDYLAELERVELNKARMKITALNDKKFLTEEEYLERYAGYDLQ